MKKWIFIKSYILPLFKFFFPSYCKSVKYVLVSGGYGYGNTGDEAQLSETIKMFENLYPNYEIKVLSPRPAFTKKYHNVATEFASRVAFWQHGSQNNCYNFKNSVIKKICFFLKGILVYLNSYLVKLNLPTLFIDAQAAKLLQYIKESSLFYYSGGGYHTGMTEPRLLDGIFVCKICEVLNTPVVMSGQSIGVWQTKFNKFFANWGFKNVKLITTRDKNFSCEALKELKLNTKTYETCDDALFCEKSQEHFYQDEYAVIHFHYWNMDENDKVELKQKIYDIIEAIPYKCIFIPMVSSDEESYYDFVDTYGKKLEIFEYDYDFRKIRSVIRDSKLCITMKHHPIIFAYGEDVPVISLIKSKYYIHKNFGAQGQYSQEKYHVILEDDDYLDSFKIKLEDLLKNYEVNVNLIKTAKIKLKQNKELFYEDLSKILI